MYRVEREAIVFDMLLKNKSVNVNELSKILKVSRETIRRDLNDMKKKGLIKRTHGGAVLAETTQNNLEYPYNVREVHQYYEKDKICKYAANFIEDGDLIFIDNSSTTNNLIKYINPNYNVTVLTNSINQLMELANLNNSNITMICLGGIFRIRNFSIVGGMSIEFANKFNPTRTFFSCRSIDLSKGLFDGSLYEVETKRTLIESSSEIILLADYSKFTATGSVYLCGLDKLTHIITDSKVSDSITRELSNYNINVSRVKL